MQTKQIVFVEKNIAKLIDIEYSEPRDNEVVVETLFSSISCGTEKANIIGDPNISISSKENEPAVFPRSSGYSSSGIVLAVGKNVTNVKVGDSVSMSWSKHKKINVMPSDCVFKYDSEKMTHQDAALMHIATFPLGAIRKTGIEIGESALVMGLGILGLFAVSLLKAAGAVPVIAVDPIPERREKALKFGADFAFDPFDADFIEKVKSVTDSGVNCAIEVTGIGKGLEQCLDCMQRFGRVALLGCTRDKNFTIDYYRKVHGPGITLIGAHTLARPDVESSPNAFTLKDDIATLRKLCSFGRISLKDMVDEVFDPEDCEAVYTRLVNDKNFPVVSQFDWRILK